jgi:hypothetical protein
MARLPATRNENGRASLRESDCRDPRPDFSLIPTGVLGLRDIL